ncbi:putative adenosine receptor A3-like [Apostichopus japonicus]|uniref:Putative adenosine receptor A3-like n=1 Tax=Stichopus japonicus TaxID=307972 RepID=A0A2G8JUE6_STIJA|nr:putative adenosine receptor A3-like [Apostichopus japonicus]
MNLTTSSDAVTGESVITTYFICELLIALFAVVGNSSIIAAFAMNRRLRTIQNYYIVSLAAIDFSMGFSLFRSCCLHWMVKESNGWGYVSSYLRVIVLMDLCSIFSIWALTFDRFYAVCRPFSYHAVMTRKRTIIHIAAAWLIL